MVYTHKSKQSRHNVVSLRIPAAVLRVLDQQAARLAVTRSQYIKLVLIDAASDSNLHRITDELQRITRTLYRYHDDLIFLASNLMANQSRFTIDEAKAWVQENFATPRPMHALD